MVELHGSDATRIFILYKSSPDCNIEWTENGIKGIHRWFKLCLQVVTRYKMNQLTHQPSQQHHKPDSSSLNHMTSDTESFFDQCFDKETFAFHNLITKLMHLTREIDVAMLNDESKSNISLSIESLIRMLGPLSPCIAREMNDIYTQPMADSV